MFLALLSARRATLIILRPQAIWARLTLSGELRDLMRPTPRPPVNAARLSPGGRNMDYKTVKNKNFRSTELAQWGEKQYITFLRFVEQFMVPSEEGPKYSGINDLWRKAEEVMLMPDHPFQEYLWRIDRFTSGKDTSYRKFFKKVNDLMQTVLKFIQNNPAVVTDEMRKILEMYPRFAWSLKQSAIVETTMGFPVVAPQAALASFDQRLYNAGVKTVDLLEKLVDSISDRDLKTMKARDKMIAIGRMGYIFNIAKSLKPNTKIFNTININGASREELEASLLRNARDE